MLCKIALYRVVFLSTNKKLSEIMGKVYKAFITKDLRNLSKKAET